MTMRMLALGLALAPMVAQEVPQALPAEAVAFFSGTWTGKGAFASGRPIEAEVSFTPELDGRWLMYRHHDLAPNRYQALGMWGRDQVSGAILMSLHDNGGGLRRFEAEGWKEGRLVFIGRTPGAPAQERFIFERQGEAFRMAYEVSKDGQAWRLIDALTFHRKR